MELLTNKQITVLVHGVWSGKYPPGSLPLWLFEFTASNLSKAVEAGFRGSFNDIYSPDYELLKSFQKNIHFFAANKTVHQLKEMNGLLTQNGVRASRKAFVDEAIKVDLKYNRHWLNTEYNTTQRLAQSGREFRDAERNQDLFPNLEFEAVMDGNTRDEHAVLDGTIRPVNDSFWSTYWPPLDWNCRCRAKRLTADEGTPTPLSGIDKPKVHPEFAHNVAQSKKIWSGKHPYFKGLTEADNRIVKQVVRAKTKAVEKVIPKPINTTAEAEERVRSLGVKEVLLKGLKPEEFRAVVDVIEKENKLSKLNLNKLVTFRRKNSTAAAMYSPSNNSIHLNLSHITNTKFQKAIPYEKQLIKIEESITKIKTDYLGKPGFNQRTVNSRINSLNRRKWDIKRRIEDGETAKPWTVSNELENKTEALKATVTHEIGHNRHFKQLSREYFNFNKKTSVSEYGRTNDKEYFAEWYSHYRTKGPDNVPADILKIFKTLK